MPRVMPVQVDPPAGALERWFRLSEHATTVRTEVLAGATTFLTLAYIIFVQPAVLGAAGMDAGAVLVATCLASAAACLLMAVLANYPIALAPGMGHNFFFAYTVVLGMQVPWEVALGAVAIAGAIFVVTAGVGLRERLITAMPASLKHGIAVGIGLLIAVVGLEWAGVIVASPGTLVTLGRLDAPPVLLALFGLTVMSGLHVWRVRGAILGGILATTAAGLVTGLVDYQGIVGRPPSLEPTFLRLDPIGALRPGMLAVIFVFFFVDLFDTVGTLVGVSQQAGLMKDGRLERAREAFLADAAGTVLGATLGTSTVTSYVESAAGVSAGGRTGLASVTTAALFLLSLLFFPLVRMIGGGFPMEGAPTLYPVIAPALVLVGTMMMRNVRLIAWDDPTEAVPAFLAVIMMPLAISITEGIAFGFIAYSFLKLVTGRSREAHWLVHLFAVLFLARYILLR
jgi:AGZA family xanthine/uracil permease-like MFS transporter